MSDARTVLAYVRRNPACTCVEIATALGVAAPYVRPVLQELRAAGKVRSVGNTRGTKWSAT